MSESKNNGVIDWLNLGLNGWLAGWLTADWLETGWLVISIRLAGATKSIMKLHFITSDHLFPVSFFFLTLCHSLTHTHTLSATHNIDGELINWFRSEQALENQRTLRIVNQMRVSYQRWLSMDYAKHQTMFHKSVKHWFRPHGNDWHRFWEALSNL